MTCPSAKGLFRDKVKYAYENLPEQLRTARAALNDASDELLLSNNSSLRVATSMRSATLNLLHVSEFGKICSRFPDRAREVITGSLNTLGPGLDVVHRSRPRKARKADFTKCAALAQTKQRLGARLSNLEARFHFLPWQYRSLLCRRALTLRSRRLRRVFR